MPAASPLPAAPVAPPVIANDDDERLRRKLIGLRDEMKAGMPDVEPGRGLLRMRVLRKVLEDRPRTEEDFRRGVLGQLLRDTDERQVHRFLPVLLRILSEG